MKRFAVATLSLAIGLASAVFAQVGLRAQNLEGTATYVTSVTTDQVLNIAGMDFATKAEVNVTTTSTTSKPDAEGKIRIQEKQDALVATLNLPQNLNVAYDSSKPETAKSDNPMLQQIIDGMSSMVGKTYTRVIDKENRLVALEGVDAVLEKTPATVREEVKKELDLAEQQRAWSQEVKRLPDGAVKQGDRWKRTEISNIGAGQTLTYDIFYDYQGPVEKNGKTYDKIGIFHENVKYAIAADSSLPIRVANQELKIESTTGALLFDRERGAVIDSTQTVKIVGPLGLSFNDMPLPGKLDLTMTTTSKKK